MAQINKLWRTVDGPGVPPAVNKRRIKAKVNAALDVNQWERKVYIKRKLCTAMAAIAILIAVTGTAFAAVSNWNALSFWFTGDTSSGQQYLDSYVRSVSDGNYTLTVESSAADENCAYIMVSITALSDEAKLSLTKRDFSSTPSFDVEFFSSSGKPVSMSGQELVKSTGYSGYELNTPEENQRRFTLAIYDLPDSASMMRVRCNSMDADAAVVTPITTAPSVTIQINASGTGVGYLSSTVTSGTLTISEITLSPFTCCIEAECSSSGIYPRPLLRMADGTIRTRSQLMDSAGSRFSGYTHKAEYRYRFKEIQNLDNIISVIVFGMEYPLDGSAPTPVGRDLVLDPFQVKRMDPLTGGGNFSIPAQELTVGLGGTCAWSAAGEEMTCVCRGITIVLRPGSLTALVNGETVELPQAPVMQEDVLAAPYELFKDAWGIECFVQRESVPNGDVWEIVWGDWYIIP